MRKYGAVRGDSDEIISYEDSIEAAKRVASVGLTWEHLLLQGYRVREIDVTIGCVAEQVWGDWLPWNGEAEYGPSFDPNYEVYVQVYRRSPKSQYWTEARANRIYWAHDGSDNDVLFFRELLVGQDAIMLDKDNDTGN